MQRVNHEVARRLKSGLIILAGAFGLMTQAHAVCYTGPQVLPAARIAEFTSNPAQVLQQNPTGGVQMITRLRDLVASDPATLQLVIGLLPSANKDQKSAIGAALAQAAKICVRSDQAFSALIQQAIADSKDPDVVLAYAAAAGDQPIGAVGGGGGVSGGGVGGQTNALGQGTPGGGGVEGINGSSANTGQFSYTGSAVSSGGVSTTSTSVSP